MEHLPVPHTWTADMVYTHLARLYTSRALLRAGSWSVPAANRAAALSTAASDGARPSILVEERLNHAVIRLNRPSALNALSSQVRLRGLWMSGRALLKRHQPGHALYSMHPRCLLMCLLQGLNVTDQVAAWKSCDFTTSYADGLIAAPKPGLPVALADPRKQHQLLPHPNFATPEWSA